MAAVDSMMSAPLTVAHILAGDAWAGAEAQVWELVQRASAHGVAAHVALLRRGEVHDRFQSLGVPLTVIDEQALSRFALARRVRAWLRDTEPAVVHTHKYKGQMLAAWALGGGARRTLVRTLHGAPEAWQGLRGVKGALATELDMLTLRYRTAAIIAVSADLATQLRLRVGRTPLAVIPNGVLVPPPGPPAEPHAPRVAYCGRLAPVKAVNRLLATLHMIRDDVPDAELWIAGEGPEEPALRELARTLGVADAVRFLGFQRDMPALLRQVDVVALSSRHEGMPMIVLEAGANAKPVVAPRVGGIPEVVRDGETGVLVADPTPEALARACVGLLRDPARAAALGAAARVHVAATFSSDATCAATVTLYRRVLDGTAGAAVPERTEQLAGSGDARL